MKHFAAATALLATITLGTQASAADAVAETVAPYDWSGVYVGLQAGGAWIDGDDGTDTVKMNGGEFGGYVGANWQSGNLVLGVEGEISYTSTDGDFMGIGYGTDWQGSLRGRIGYALDRLLIYGAGGFAVTRAYIDAAPFLDTAETLTGWTVGGGAEYAFTQNWIARADYRYSDYGRTDFGIGTMGFGDVSEVHFTEHAVRVGIAYKF